MEDLKLGFKGRRFSLSCMEELYTATWCSTNNKNPESDIGVKAEDQRSKAAKPPESSYFYRGWGDPVLSVPGD